MSFFIYSGFDLKLIADIEVKLLNMVGELDIFCDAAVQHGKTRFVIFVCCFSLFFTGAY